MVRVELARLAPKLRVSVFELTATQLPAITFEAQTSKLAAIQNRSGCWSLKRFMKGFT
ncbi:hypothetical protein D3C78_1718410 [compost metagenome]